MVGAEVRIEFDKRKLAELVELLGKVPEGAAAGDLPRAEPDGAVDALARQP